MRVLSAKTREAGPVEVFGRRMQDQLLALREGLARLNPNASREQIHQLRVLSRRARASWSLLEACQPTKPVGDLGKILKSVTGTLGPVRSLDVMHRDLKSLAKADSLQPWVKAMKKDRQKLRKRLCQKLVELQFFERLEPNALTLALQTLPSEIWTQTLKQQKATLATQLEQSWRKFQQSGKMKDLHCARIALKKWRYLQEVASACEGTPSEEFLQQLKHYQDQLGFLQDQRILREQLKKKKMKRLVHSKKSQHAYRQVLQSLKKQIQNEKQRLHQMGQGFLSPILGRSV